jgi:hypothetical protein
MATSEMATAAAITAWPGRTLPLPDHRLAGQDFAPSTDWSCPHGINSSAQNSSAQNSSAQQIGRTRELMDRQLRVFSTIEALQADFPGFVIWGETVRGRYAYVAQALDGETNPRVVTSASLDRLRAQLEEPLASSDPAQPNVARIYDYLLGGHFL